jgi:hypothetical protein
MMRYRYYVSQAVLQNRNEEAGSIARVAAPDIEDLVIVAVRHQVGDVNREADRPSRGPRERPEAGGSVSDAHPRDRGSADHGGNQGDRHEGGICRVARHGATGEFDLRTFEIRAYLIAKNWRWPPS